MREYKLPFEKSHTKAFGNWYVQGIYLNDSKRFSGPVKEGEKSQLVQDICKKFNEHELSKQHRLSAKPFREVYPESVWNDKLPDILIEKPDEYFFAKGKAFVETNENYGPIPEDISTFNDMHSGQKSRDPLFAASPDVASLIKDSDELKIPLVNHLVRRYFDC